MTSRSNPSPAEARESRSANGAEHAPQIDSAALVRPKFGETVSGDAALVVPIEDGLLAAIVDVLGHGEEAAPLALKIDRFLRQHAGGRVTDLLRSLHDHIHGSRGAAVGLCAIECATGRLHYAGVGNTVFRRFGAGETRLVSRDGIVGSSMRTPVEEHLQLDDGDLVVLSTDGVKSRFDPSSYDWFHTGTADRVAANLLHRFGKMHDDASCVVLRYRQ